MQDTTKPIDTLIKQNVWGSIKQFLNLGFHIDTGQGTMHLTIGLLLVLVLALVGTNLFLRWLRSFLTRNMQQTDKLKFISVFKFIKYLIYLAVVLITLSIAGVNLTVLLTASAAFFVGLGLALQELFQDVIAGVLILVDKSLVVGDIIEVEGKVARVFEIKLRTTRALTRDDKVLVIPNHKFISDVVFNHTQNQKTTREAVTVGVAYGSDVDLVSQLLLEVAQDHKAILKKPQPFVLFEDFGDSALIFSIQFYTNNSFSDPNIKSDLRFSINKKFHSNNVIIPFPQRDIHLYQK